MREKNSGFTLVELIVVISIIAVLMGILMPALAATRRIAKRTICKSNLHSLSLSFRMYLDDNKNVMPWIDNMPNKHYVANPVAIYSVIGKYLGDRKVLQCPADRGTVSGTTFFDTGEQKENVKSYYAEQGSSYEYNQSLANQNVDKSWFAKRFGINEIYLLRDYSSFHGKPGKAGSVIYLFADTLVADRERKK